MPNSQNHSPLFQCAKKEIPTHEVRAAINKADKIIEAKNKRLYETLEAMMHLSVVAQNSLEEAENVAKS